MNIQVNSDKNISLDVQATSAIEAEVNRALEIFAGKVTRIELHVSDVNSDKPGVGDKRCLLEVRPAGRRPLAVTSSAESVEAAVRGALGKMRTALSRSFGKEGAPRARAQREGTLASSRPGKRKSASGQVTAKRKKPAATKAAANKAPTKKTVAKRAALSPRGPKKKPVYRARRKSWPKRGK